MSLTFAHSPVTGGPLVVKLGGAALERSAALDDIFGAIAAAHAASAPGGTGGVVVVHGGGAAVDRHLERLSIVSERRDGIRITPAHHVDEVVAVLAGAVNTTVVGHLQRRGGAPAVGLSLAAGFLARTVKLGGHAFDPGQVGEIDGGDPAVVHTLLRGGFLPVVSSIGLDAAGLPLNVNADHAAAGVASVVGARALVFVTDVPGVLDAAGAIVPSLTRDELETRIASGEISGGMIPKVRGAMHAAATASIPVTIAGGDADAVLAALDGRGGARFDPPGAATSALGAVVRSRRRLRRA